MDLYSQALSLVPWFTTHTTLAYIILFVGSFFEIFVFTSFLIYGEIIFLVGGALASIGILDIWIVTLALYSGSILGDSASYSIGFHLGKKAFKKDRIVFSISNYEKGSQFFERYGNKAVFFARLSGPIAWITPFLAGVYKMPYRVFLPYNVAGIILGVGQFIAIGYFFGFAFMQILAYVKDALYVPIIIVVVVTILYFFRKHYLAKSS
jgi:membrane protein DedA with SNARE-associated domain